LTASNSSLDNHIEHHPLEPFLPGNAKVLLLGSFPPPKGRWKMDFYYPNFQNDMWRIFGLVFFSDKDYFLTIDKLFFNKEKIISFLSDKGIAITDSGREVIRRKGNASDNHLEIVQSIDFDKVISQIPQCKYIGTAGEKATETFRLLFNSHLPKLNLGEYANFNYQNRELCACRLPSTSRAYPKSLTDKAAEYAQFFRKAGLL